MPDMIVKLITTGAVTLGALCAPMAFAADEHADLLLAHFSYSAGQWEPPHDDFVYPGVDLEADLKKEGGKLLTVRVDVDGDGVPEDLLRTLCGNGGCEYPIFDGRTHVFLGSVFGSEVWLLQRRSHALPVIETFSHLAAMLGTIARYEFNGTRYEKVSSREIGDVETQLLYKRLGAAPRIKAP
jgi:hypothetical protein